MPPDFSPESIVRAACGKLLTLRERQVLDYLAYGRANKVIAIELGISMRTVEAHRARIFRKLGLRNGLELICHLCPHRLAGGLAEPTPVYTGVAAGLSCRKAASASSSSPQSDPDRAGG